jgi:hypothetical protein
MRSAFSLELECLFYYKSNFITIIQYGNETLGSESFTFVWKEKMAQMFESVFCDIFYLFITSFINTLSQKVLTFFS